MRVLKIWTYCIYKHPKDFPDKYVVRRFIGEQPTDYHFVADTLEEVRDAIPSGLFRMDRQVNDDPVIVEVWL